MEIVRQSVSRPVHRRRLHGDAVAESDGWEIVSRETHFQNDHLSVATEETRTPARPAPRKWTVVRRKKAVVIAPMTGEGKIILIRQERIPIRAARAPGCDRPDRDSFRP